jgi:hypothetical protein
MIEMYIMGSSPLVSAGRRCLPGHLAEHAPAATQPHAAADGLNPGATGVFSMDIITTRGGFGYRADAVFVAFGLIRVVVIPVIVMALSFGRRYRSSNRKAACLPEWCHSARIEAAMWMVSGLIVAAHGTVTWISTYRPDPLPDGLESVCLYTGLYVLQSKPDV